MARGMATAAKEQYIQGRLTASGKSRAPSRRSTSRRKGFLSRMAEGYRG